MIVGLITTLPRQQAECEMRCMVAALRHEPGCEAGTWIDDTLGLYVGWVARKNSFSGGMPLQNEKRDVSLVFSGEDYGASAAIRDLKQRGHEFETEGPSYLVHAYEDDPTFPAGLNGRFHGVVVDQRRAMAMLFNDRYGMHRLYCYESKETFYFAAEAKAILAVCPELRSVDPRGLGELVSCGCVLENRTVFQGIQVLPPAAAWVLRGGRVGRKNTYFDPAEWENQTPLDSEAYYQQLRQVFSRTLPRYFSGRERIGVSLTGGLDTRMIMAWWKCQPGSIPCYTFGGAFRDSWDVIVARQVARAHGHSHEVIPAGKNFLRRFAHYAERAVYLTDGCVGVKHAPDLYLNEQAAQIAPIRMTGNYGSEVLRRVRAFKPEDTLGALFQPEFLTYIRATRDTYRGVLDAHPLSFAVFRQAPWHHFGLLALEDTQLTVRTPYLDNDLVRTVFRAPESACANNQICLRLIAEGDPTLRGIMTDRGIGDTGGSVAGAARRHWLDFTFKAEYAYDIGMPHWLARIDHLLSAFRLERYYLGRHKFAHFRVWYRDSLAGYVRDMLLDSRSLSRPYLQRNTVETIVRGHLRGDRNYTSEIHKLLSMELIHRVLIDRR